MVFEGHVRGFAGRVDWMWRAREKEQHTQLWRKPLLLLRQEGAGDLCRGGGTRLCFSQVRCRQLADLWMLKPEVLGRGSHWGRGRGSRQHVVDT